jgi:hypothetical protein
MNDRPSLLKNTDPRQNAVAITLKGVKSNRSAIGARCTIVAGGRKQLAEVLSGGSYYSQNALTLYFGLGKSATIDRLSVRWPNGDEQSWTRIPANRFLEIAEGADSVQQRPFPLPR